MSAEVFVDTNVLVYSRDATDPEKQRKAAEWLEWIWEMAADGSAIKSSRNTT